MQQQQHAAAAAGVAESGKRAEFSSSSSSRGQPAVTAMPAKDKVEPTMGKQSSREGRLKTWDATKETEQKGHTLGSKTDARAKQNQTPPRWLENTLNKQEVVRETGSPREKRIQEVDLQKQHGYHGQERKEIHKTNRK